MRTLTSVTRAGQTRSKIPGTVSVILSSGVPRAARAITRMQGRTHRPIAHARHQSPRGQESSTSIRTLWTAVALLVRSDRYSLQYDQRKEEAVSRMTTSDLKVYGARGRARARLSLVSHSPAKLGQQSDNLDSRAARKERSNIQKSSLETAIIINLGGL